MFRRRKVASKSAEVVGEKTICDLDLIQEELDDNDDGQGDATAETGRLAFKSGYVTLKERISSLSEKSSPKNNVKSKVGALEDESRRKQRQFATLSELFSSKFFATNHNNNNNNPADQNAQQQQQQQQPRRTKIPIMKLNKDDWNVKCWEDRLSRRKRQPQTGGESKLAGEGSGRVKKRVDVFKGRIEEVATKLEKVREGTPKDEKLYQLILNKRSNIESNCSHGWTDLLKSELASGTHNPKQLKNSIDRSTSGASGNDWPVGGGGDSWSCRASVERVKSPLGRPIGRIFDSDSDQDDD